MRQPFLDCQLVAFPVNEIKLSSFMFEADFLQLEYNKNEIHDLTLTSVANF